VLEQLAGFYTGQQVVLIWDGLSVHWSTKMRAWLDSQRDWLTVERLPAYAPELNPVAYLWANLKALEPGPGRRVPGPRRPHPRPMNRQPNPRNSRKTREGQLEGFKQQAAEVMRQAREKDTGTVAYDWYVSSDGTQCEVRSPGSACSRPLSLPGSTDGGGRALGAFAGSAPSASRHAGRPCADAQVVVMHPGIGCAHGNPPSSREDTAMYLIRERFFRLGEDSEVIDEHGRPVLQVDGKVLSLRNRLVLRDPEGGEVAQVQRKLVAMRPTYQISIAGREAAEVRKRLFTPFGDRFTIDVPGPDDLEMTGDLLDHEFTIRRGGQTVATVSKRWFSMRDTYAVDVAAGQDDLLLLASVLALDLAEDQERTQR
jgi:uncharacterized protein YxjI